MRKIGDTCIYKRLLCKLVIYIDQYPAKDEKIIQEVEVKNNGMMEESDDEEEAIDEEDDSDEKVRNCFILDCFRTFGNGGKDIKDIFRKIRYCFVS